MRPSKLFLWLCFGSLIIMVLVIAVPVLDAQWALTPFVLLVVALVVDLLVSIRPANLGLSFECADEVFSGEDFEFKLSLTLASRWAPAKPITANFAYPEGITGPQDIAISRLGLETNFLLTARRRGRWVLEKIWLNWHSRFGLIDFAPVRVLKKLITVVPNIRPVVSGEIDLKLRTTLFGAKQTAWRGEGSDFHQLTDYVAGMDPRSIDWKQSARHQKMVAREMRAEQNHQIIMVLDNGHLMREEIIGLPKIDHKINAALALAWAGVQSGDLVGMFAFDARPRLFVPPASGQKAFAQLRTHTAALEYQSVQANHTLALSHLYQRLQKRSLIVIFSDFVDPFTAELLLDHMAVLQKRHVVIFVSLRDPLLERLARAKTASMDDVARSVSATNLLHERRTVFEKMSAMGVHVLEADPGGVTPRLLSLYLDIKAREVI